MMATTIRMATMTGITRGPMRESRTGSSTLECLIDAFAAHGVLILLRIG